jgi:hypothetical protein
MEFVVNNFDRTVIMATRTFYMTEIKGKPFGMKNY